jgi:hypothetical protein
MRHPCGLVVLAVLAPLTPSLRAPAADPAGATAVGMKKYESRYYVIHTDLDLDAAREAYVRMDAIAEEYHRRTKGFGRTIRRKLPFYLYRTREDYYLAGGKIGSAGMFVVHPRESKLMAFAGKKLSPYTWHVIQHEAFHQFAFAAISHRLPVWVNEGLAEYFGHGIFTGDDFVTGIVPPGRLERLKGSIKAEKLMPFRRIMSLSRSQWSVDISMHNYDQAWSMIHFLVHGEDGKYVKPLSTFISNISRGSDYEPAWIRSFGRDIDGFEKKCRQWWLAQGKNPSADTYALAAASTVNSFFARSFSQQQRFDSADAFLKSARTGKLKCHKLDWLPPGLLALHLPQAERLGKWVIEKPPRRLPQLVCQLEDGRKLVGTFAVRGGRVRRVRVQLVPKEEPGKPLKRPASTRPAS